MESNLNTGFTDLTYLALVSGHLTKSMMKSTVSIHRNALSRKTKLSGQRLIGRYQGDMKRAERDSSLDARVMSLSLGMNVTARFRARF